MTDVGDRSINSATFRVIVTPGCSGVAGFLLTVVVVFSARVYCRREYRFARALMLLPASVVVVYMLNGVRIAVLFLVGHLGSPVVAVRAFHSQIGSMMFNIAIAMLLVSGSRFLRHSRQCFGSPGLANLKGNR